LVPRLFVSQFSLPARLSSHPVIRPQIPDSISHLGRKRFCSSFSINQPDFSAVNVTVELPSDGILPQFSFILIPLHTVRYWHDLCRFFTLTLHSVPILKPDGHHNNSLPTKQGGERRCHLWTETNLLQGVPCRWACCDICTHSKRAQPAQVLTNLGFLGYPYGRFEVNLARSRISKTGYF